MESANFKENRASTEHPFENPTQYMWIWRKEYFNTHENTALTLAKWCRQQCKPSAESIPSSSLRCFMEEQGPKQERGDALDDPTPLITVFFAFTTKTIYLIFKMPCDMPHSRPIRKSQMPRAPALC